MSETKTYTSPLYEPFENIPTRKGRGGVYSYVKWQNVADRMNRVFGSAWSSEVVFQDIIGENVIVRVKVHILDKVEGKMFFQEGYGGAPNDQRLEAGNPFKAAYSKALKDACKKWGVALFLDEDSDDSYSSHSVPSTGAESAHVPTSKSRPEWLPDVKDMPTPPNVVKKGSGGSMEVPASVSMTRSSSSMPNTPNSMSTPPPVKNSMPTPPGGGKSMPTPPSSVMPPAPIASKTEAIDTGGIEYISNVQKAALHSILAIKDVDYDVLVKEAFEAAGMDKPDIPKPDMLTYTEAVCVVKYGNDKFRRR